MKTEWPAILRQQTDHRREFLFHTAGQVGARFQEVLKIRGRKDQHFSSAVVTEVVIALARLEHAGPVLKIRQFALRLLREEIICNANSQLAILVKLLDDLVVLRVVLEAASRVDRAGDPKAVQFAHEVP